MSAILCPSVVVAESIKRDLFPPRRRRLSASHDVSGEVEMPELIEDQRDVVLVGLEELSRAANALDALLSEMGL